MALARSLLVVVVLLPAGCTEPNPYLAEQNGGSGSGSSSSTGGSGSSGTSSTSRSSNEGSTTAAPPGCVESGQQCIDVAPAGWSGPFAWREADAELPGVVCLAPWDQLLTEAFSDIVAPAARCGCACGPLTGASCGGGTMTYHLGPGCVGPSLTPFELQAGCNDPGAPWLIEGSFAFEPPTVTAGSCMPQPTEVLDPARFLTRHLACGAELSEEDCGEGQLCAPMPEEPLFGRWCVWQTGDVECPTEGPYQQPRRLFGDLDDGRGCEPCTCALPSGPCTGSSLQLAHAADCMGTSAGSVSPGGCSDGVGGDDVEAVSHQPGSPPGGSECESAVVTPVGMASGSQPVTFCCTDDG